MFEALTVAMAALAARIETTERNVNNPSISTEQDRRLSVAALAVRLETTGKKHKQPKHSHQHQHRTTPVVSLPSHTG